jgi:hypothetical protein
MVSRPLRIHSYQLEHCEHCEGSQPDTYEMNAVTGYAEWQGNLLTWLGYNPRTPPLQRLGASTAHGGKPPLKSFQRRIRERQQAAP